MAKLAIKKASTDVTVYLFVQASNVTTGAGLTGLAYNTASLVASYVRPLAARAALSLATQTVDGAHSDGGFIEVDATNMPGIYRLDLPDAVCAAGVNSVIVMLKGAANMSPVVLEIQLTTFDLNTDIVGADSDTLKTLSDQMDEIAIWSAGAISASYTAGAITDIRGSSWSIAMPNLTLDANKQQFVLKRRAQDLDEDAILFVDSETGLLTLNGVSTGLTAADCTLVYAGTTLTLTAKASVTAQIAPASDYPYGIQHVTAAGLVEEPYGGTFTVIADIVRATA